MNTRVIPCLLLSGRGLVKTVRFKDAKYVGDPRNAVKIFNEKEVDELVVIDIMATRSGTRPSFDLIREIVSEAFMPMAYGGGLRSIEDVRVLLQIGIEKAVVSAAAVDDPTFVSALADAFGSQSVVICLDVMKTRLGRYELTTHGGTKKAAQDPIRFAAEMERRGAGEIIVNSVDRDGTMSGYDVDLIRAVSSAVNIPVIACGGAGRLEDFREAVRSGGASGVAAGSLFVYHGKHRAVLISYPSQADMKRIFESTILHPEE